ncbi:MAG: cation diffusion facilitator family transporter [Nitrospirota bacterium]
MKDGERRKRGATAYEGKRIAIKSLGLNIFFTITKFLLYIYAGSTALLAEAIHSLTDVISSLLIVGGIHIAERKSEQFPWGLYKAENIAAVLSAGLILFSAYEIAAMIYRPSSEDMRNLDVSLIALLMMAPLIIFFSRYEARRAKALNSPSLLADAENWKMDIAPLAVVISGIAGAYLSFPVMDRIAASLILLLVVKTGYRLLRDSVRSLLDASVDKATLGAIRDAIKAFPEVKGIASLHARSSGRFIFAETTLTLSQKRLKEAHEVADAIERSIKNRIPFVEKVAIHYEPERKEYTRYAVPLADREGAISEHFSRAPFIALWDKSADGAVRSREILENPFTEEERARGIRLAALLAAKGLDVLYTKESFNGKGSAYVLSDAGVEVRETESERLITLIEEHSVVNARI